MRRRILPERRTPASRRNVSRRSQPQWGWTRQGQTAASSSETDEKSPFLNGS